MMAGARRRRPRQGGHENAASSVWCRDTDLGATGSALWYTDGTGYRSVQRRSDLAEVLRNIGMRPPATSPSSTIPGPLSPCIPGFGASKRPPQAVLQAPRQWCISGQHPLPVAAKRQELDESLGGGKGGCRRSSDGEEGRGLTSHGTVPTPGGERGLGGTMAASAPAWAQFGLCGRTG